MEEYGHVKKRRVRPKSIVMLLLYALILVCLVTAALLWDKKSQQHTEVFGSLEGRFTSDIALNFNGKTLYYRENEITNYLLIGTDQNDIQADSHQSGGQADFLLILSVDRVNRTITPFMIDRDTMANVTTFGIFGNPSGSRVMQICLAQAFSGTGVSGGENTAEAVSRLLYGVKIDRCLVMGLDGIPLLNDAVGGVEVTVQDDLTALDSSLRKGETVKLNGTLAESFVRGRTTLADGTNEARMKRQSAYLDALIKRVSALVREDKNAFERIFTSLSGHVETNVSQSVLISESNAFQTYAWKELVEIRGTHRIGEDGFTEFWPDEAQMKAIVAGIWFE